MEEFTARLRVWANENRALMIVMCLGLVLSLGGGMWWWRNLEPVEVEIITEEVSSAAKIWVDVQGAVEKPGAYELETGSRVKDALLAAGGLSSDADRNYISRHINLAQKVTDGIKVFVPAEGELVVAQASIQGSSTQVLNLNVASQSQLEKLPGIGESRAKSIIDARPYTSVDDLLSKKVVPKSVFEDIKELVSVY